MPNYLDKQIVSSKRTDAPRYGMTSDGYTKKSGAPTGWMILLEGEKRYRRVMVWQFSNAGTVFVRVRGEALIIRNEWDIPAVEQKA